MTNQAYSVRDDQATGHELTVYDDQPHDGTTSQARPVPRISIQAFCESPATAEAIQVAAEDRRLAKAHVSIHMGGASAAVAHYQDSPTPNLIVIESTFGRDHILGELDRLAETCDAGTKVVVIGKINDVLLYREMLRRGVSEYLVQPVQPTAFMEAVSSLYNDPDTDPVGSVIAFIGAKGGVGSSTICHNVAWTMSETLGTDVVITDLDLAFGTTGLDFNQDPVQGVADALSAPERLDDQLLDRLLTKCSQHLSIFAAPVVLDRDFEISPESCEAVIDVVRQNVPLVVVDLPHLWTAWSKRLLLQADEVVITACPDLANLRNAKNIIDLLKQNRAHDGPPRLVINMANTPKRPEISVKDFCDSIDLQASAVIEFDSETFGLAANNGQMLAEHNRRAKAVPVLHSLAMSLANRREIAPEVKKSSNPLGPLLEKLKLKR